MPTYRLLVEYDGTKFSGWQVQVRRRTVQGVLLEKLRHVTGHQDLDLQGSGRTDSGVHALGQVASLRCPAPLRPDHVLVALDRELPQDLAVLAIDRADDRFHARHDAVLRSYRYQIARRRSAFGKRVSWWLPGRLDVGAMGSAAAAFVGRHDYAPFAKRDRGQKSTIVVVEQCLVHEVGDVILVRVAASHFLWGQVRRMVGALAAVGRGDQPPEAVSRWLAGDEPPPRQAAPGAGLFLERVLYPGEPPELPPLLPIGIPAPSAAGAGSPPPTTRIARSGRKR